MIPALRGELLPVRTYTSADGLASDTVTCIFADSRGLLWFCTPEGLSRFDGRRFVTYGAAEGISHSVSAVTEARAGGLFAGAASGLIRIGAGASRKRFSVYAVPDWAAKKSVIALSEARSGGEWLATSRELFRWTEPGSMRQRPLRPGPIQIESLLEDRRGGLWVGTSSGLIILHPGGEVQNFSSATGLPGDWVNTMLLGSDGRVWAGIRGGLAQFACDTNKCSVEKVYTKQSGLAGYGVNALLEASDGTLWVATGLGISLLKTDRFGKPILQNLTRAQGLVARTIMALAEDHSGNVWIGTEGAGAMRIDRGGFTTYTEADGLRSDKLHSVFGDRSGNVVAVTVLDGDKRFPRSLDVFDGVRFHGVHPGTYAQQPSWGWNQIVLQSHTGEWWAATDRGLCRFPAVKALELNMRAPLKCYSEGTIFRIFEDSRGGIWASGQSNPNEKGARLMRWDPEDNALTEFPPPRITGESLMEDLVSAFAEDRDGNIWMGLYGGGLHRYDRHGFRHFGEKEGVPAGGIYALLANASGLWIASQHGGLAHVADPGVPNPVFDTIGTAQGLSSNIVNCLVDDREGRIYAGTGKGVDRFDPKTAHVRHFSTADGLARGELLSAMRDSDGSLWFATTQGLSKLVHQADRPPVVPGILITDLRVGDREYAVSPLGESRISSIELDPSGNQMQVEFAGIDYEPGDTVRYSYALQGADGRWSSPAVLPSVNYAALSSGRFRFLVKAVTSEGIESPAPAEIDFLVLPPVWKRWWFQSLVLVFVCIAVYAAHRYRVTQMVEMERMRTAIATDLHDDIGASLSQIAILSEVARSSAGSPAPGEPLERIASVARELVDSMSDIVWSIRSETRGMESLPSRMREFALDLLGPRGIDFEMQTPTEPEDAPLSLQARRQIFLMFKECIHNAARHSGCTTVNAELKYSAHELTLLVQDNGVGLDFGQNAHGATGGTGIAGMRRRAEGLGGRMELTSGKGMGCRIAIHIPARRRHRFSRMS